MSQSFTSLAQYAERQGAPISAFIAAGYDPQPVRRHNRPALRFNTKTGQRFRFMDDLIINGEKQRKYDHDTTYRQCWYNLPAAIERSRQTGQPLSLVNGEAGQVVAFYHGIAATCVTSGEKGGYPAHLIDELKTLYPEGEIRIYFDCDKPGSKAAAALAQQLTLAGYTVRAIDLQLPNEGGDIANFCKANPVNTLAALAALPDLPKAPEERRYQPVIVQDTETPPELIQAIAAALNAPPPNARGFSRANVTCPFSENHSHGDKVKSASFNWNTGAIYCHTAGCDNHGHKAVAERKGIDWRRYYPQPERRELGLSHNFQNSRPTPAATTQPEPAPDAAPRPLPDAAILEIAPTFTPGTAMLTRLADELNAGGKLSPFCRADLRKALEAASYPMTTNTFNAAYFWFVELNCQKSHTGKKEGLQYDFFDILPFEGRMPRLKAAIWTRLVQEAYPESDRAAALIAFFPRMAIDTLGAGEDAGAITEALNQVLPLPDGEKEEAQEIFQKIEADYRAILKLLADDTVTRLDPASLNEVARSNPATYLNVLRHERYKPYDGMQLSGKQRSALMGIRDPRQRYRKEKALGITTEEVKPKEEIKDIADIERQRRRHIAFPLRLFALNREGEVTASMGIADDDKAPDSAFRQRRKAEFVTTQRAAGYTVIAEYQARSRVKVGNLPERKPVTRQNVTTSKPEILQNTATNQPARTAPLERPDEIPGRYTDHWVKFHILRRLVRDERGFYTNPYTGELIPADMTGSLAELIEALTGYKLTQRQEQTA